MAKKQKKRKKDKKLTLTRVRKIQELKKAANAEEGSKPSIFFEKIIRFTKNVFLFRNRQKGANYENKYKPSRCVTI